MQSFCKLFKNKKDIQFIYLTPAEDDLVRWEFLDQEELDRRVEENLLVEGARLFKIDKEITIRFEKLTYLE